ncbi:MAG: hypothetical protein HN348_28070 [Proteobacteria bacterium]|nr:hypothetical protein [Pseudomonadota bacterium]
MARADEYLALLDDPDAPVPIPEHPADEGLLAILVHLACADGMVQEEEFELFEQIRPGMGAGEILAWVADVASTELDLQAVGSQLPTDEDRIAALRFAARLAWADNVLAFEEAKKLRQIARAFELHDDIIEDVMNEIVARPSSTVTGQEIQDAIDQTLKLDVARKSSLFSELHQVVPPGATPIAGVLVDGKEQVGLYDTGLAAHFVEGPHYIGWDDIELYTRVRVFGASLRIITKDGQTLTVENKRLRGIGELLDRIYGVQSKNIVAKEVKTIRRPKA